MTVKLTYYGHSTFGADVDGTKLIIDPFFAPNNPVATVTVDEVEADFILITHGHSDHIVDAVALAKRTGAQCIANFEIVGWLNNQGIDNTHPLHIGGGNSFPFGRVKMTIAHHGSGLPDGSYGGNPGGFLINFNDGTDVLFAGDTALTYDMRLIGEVGGVDLAVLPIGDNFTMGPDDAVIAAEFIKAKRVVPCHYNTWPYIEQDPNAYADKLDAIDIDCTVMDVNDSLTV
ncbi:MAG: metal-dependent hydrolase [Caldilineaceae bacterium]|nr:metal-dependent hydrolase [Caldilineaceae bacterium]